MPFVDWELVAITHSPAINWLSRWRRCCFRCCVRWFRSNAITSCHCSWWPFFYYLQIVIQQMRSKIHSLLWHSLVCFSHTKMNLCRKRPRKKSARFASYILRVSIFYDPRPYRFVCKQCLDPSSRVVNTIANARVKWNKWKRKQLNCVHSLLVQFLEFVYYSVPRPDAAHKI